METPNLRPVPTTSKVDLAFGCIQYMPARTEIPEVFRYGSNEWVSLVSRWFFRGLRGIRLTPKPGVDEQAALAAVSAILVSFEPKHEHKVAACAFLLSEWFERFDEVPEEDGGVVAE